jgi:hypothetical protein
MDRKFLEVCRQVLAHHEGMRARPLARKKPVPGPLELFFMLVDSCMHRLRPNAWKVVSYVAAQHIRVHPEWIERRLYPIDFLTQQVAEHVGIIDPSGDSRERPYRPGGPAVPGEQTGRFAIISLDVLCRGVKIKRRWRDYGTGLSKSSVAKAINEALKSGILVRQKNKSGRGRDLSSLYAIDWDRVQEYDWQRRKRVSTMRTHQSGENPANKA